MLNSEWRDGNQEKRMHCLMGREQTAGSGQAWAGWPRREGWQSAEAQGSSLERGTEERNVWARDPAV